MGIIDKLVKRFNSEDVIKFSDKNSFKEVSSWAHTGSPELDYNLGTFGLPTGIIEIAGPSASGKTTLGLVGMKNFLASHPNGIAVILSSENRDNREYAQRLGIDIDLVMIVKIRYVEKMFLQVKNLIEEAKEIFKEEKIGEAPKFYFLWDSLGATLSRSELDTMAENTAEMEKKMKKGEELEKLKHEKIGAFAKPAKMFAKFLVGEMYNTTIHFVMLNHVYDKIGGMGKKSTGGEWVELMSTIRLRMATFKTERLDDAKVSQITKITVEKNDFGSRRETKIEILFGFGIVLSEEDIAFGVEHGIITKEGAKKHSAIGGKVTWNSKRTLYQLYWSKNKYVEILNKKIAKERHKQVIAERESYD